MNSGQKTAPHLIAESVDGVDDAIPLPAVSRKRRAMDGFGTALARKHRALLECTTLAEVRKLHGFLEVMQAERAAAPSALP
jgi:hypothetical protein